MYYVCDTANKLLKLYSAGKPEDVTVLDGRGKSVPFRLLRDMETSEGMERWFDASALQMWSPDNPVLYTLQTAGEQIRIGFSSIGTFRNECVLLNGKPLYIRGYIRGIAAHEHPNMTGQSLRAAAQKNIRQAKKYGFNLVRFHSTVPAEEFVEAADEEGLLIHLETSFAYERDAKGNKTRLSMDNSLWRETLLRYRNHPSIAIFCIGNEMHNSGHYPEVHALYGEGKKLAPGKLIMDNSGWGEFDRTTADIFSQHIAYFFPAGAHKDMFQKEDPWLMNGSAYDEVLRPENSRLERAVVPVRPVIAHEACHYIEIPDYQALNDKFDAFCAEVGSEYLEANGIRKPRYMTELPELIRRKRLEKFYPDYIRASRHFKMTALKTYLEKCRLSSLCGFEMLQFADCLKYENKNGIVDCFDDDKFIPADWMLQFNGNAALLFDRTQDVFASGESVRGAIKISNFLPAPEVQDGKLEVTLSCPETGTVPLYRGGHFVLTGGLQELVRLDFPAAAGKTAREYTLCARLEIAGKTLVNKWLLWCYPEAVFESVPAELRLKNQALAELLDGAKEKRSGTVLTDTLDDEVFDDLAKGKTVYCFYSRDNQANKYYLPCALERFKPCIWDRGSNLGGVIRSEELKKALASGGFFDTNCRELLEAGFKVNLDGFPAEVNEIVFGADKPVRDRMKGLVHGVKKFIDADTLRNFSHLWSVRAGTGLLVVCTFNFTEPGRPAVKNFLAELLGNPAIVQTDCRMDLDVLKNYIAEQTRAGFRKEDVMNHFWEIDCKLVEDTLFWEEAKLDLTKID